MKSPRILALTPVDVNKSMDRSVGSKTIASLAYSSTISGAAKPKHSITVMTKPNIDNAIIVGHLEVEDFPSLGSTFCKDRKDEAAAEWDSS